MSTRDRATGTDPLVIWLVVLGVLVVALGAWVVYDTFFAAEAPPNGAADVVAAYTDAWNDHDGQTFLTLVTDDYEFENAVGVFGRTEQGAAIGRGNSYDFEVEEIGSPIWNGAGSTWLMARANRVFSVDHPDEGIRGISVIEVVETADGWQVARHTWIPDS